jgi:hypothetical protein
MERRATTGIGSDRGALIPRTGSANIMRPSRERLRRF